MNQKLQEEIKQWIRIATRPRLVRDTLRNYGCKKFGITPEEIEPFLPLDPERLPSETEILAGGIQKSTKVIDITCMHDKTPRSLLIAHGYHPEQWEVIGSKQKAWNTYSKLDKIQNLWSSTITVKPIQLVFTVDELKQRFEKFKAPYLPEYDYDMQEPAHRLFELELVDFHLSKLSWGKEVEEDYDVKIASDIYRKIMARARDLADENGADEIIFPIGQDFFNVDNANHETTKGTPQSMDSRWTKMFYRGCELVIEAVEGLRKVCPVRLIYVPGNHDRALSFFLCMHLQAYYRNTDSVSVDVSPRMRKYFEFGDCMLGFAHGEEKHQNIVNLMQAEAPEMWGHTTHRELHLAHRHSEGVTELPGVIIRRLSSVTATDVWHYEQGWVATQKKAQAFLWDHTNGLEAIFNINGR